MRLIVRLLLQDIQIAVRFSRDAYVRVSYVDECVRTYAAWHGQWPGQVCG